MSHFIDFEELKASVSIEDVFPILDISFRQTQPNQWRARCPTCDSSDNRSLCVTAGAKQKFYCFAWGRGGDVIGLVAHVLGIGQKDAAEQIVDRLGTGTVPGTVPSRDPVPNDDDRPPESGTAGKLQPLSYLKPDHDAVVALGLSKETCEHFGAGYAPRGIMRGRLAIPIHDLTGELVAYCGRAVRDDQEPLLLFPKGFQPERYLYNLDRVKEGELYCTSDPLEVLLAYENGVENVIAFLVRPNRNVVAFPKKGAGGRP